jgi:hypothetical protein
MHDNILARKENLILMELIKNVYIMKNAYIYNKHHEKKYLAHLLCIEFEDGKRHILDIDSKQDITYCDYLEPMFNKKSKIEIII